MKELSEMVLYNCGIDIERIRKRFGAGKTLIIRTRELCYESTDISLQDLRLSLCINLKKVSEIFGKNKKIIITIPNPNDLAQIAISDL